MQSLFFLSGIYCTKFTFEYSTLPNERYIINFLFSSFQFILFAIVCSRSSITFLPAPINPSSLSLTSKSSTLRTKSLRSSQLTRTQIAKLRKIVAQHTSGVTADVLWKVADEVNLPESTCRNWLRQHGVVVHGRSAASNSRLGFAALGHPSTKISNTTKGSLTRLQSSFFWRLPYYKQIDLLKHTSSLATATNQMTCELAERLDLPLDKMKLWIKCRRKKLQKILDSPKLTSEKSALLRAEFTRKNRIDDDEALLLSHLFSIPVRTILHYFSVQRAKLKYKQSREDKKQESDEVGSPPPPKEPASPAFVVMPPQRPRSMKYKSGRFFTPSQLNALFDEYKRNPNPNSDRCTTLATAVGLSPLQISNWFCKLRQRLDSYKVNSLAKALNENIRPRQLAELECKYRKAKFLFSDEAHALSQKLGMSKHSVIIWFSRRRMYELRMHQQGDTDSKLNVKGLSKAGDMNVKDEPEAAKSSEASTSVSPEPSLARILGRRPTFLTRLPSFKRVRLLKVYKTMRYRDIARVSKELDLPEDKVRTWFKNRRYTEMRAQKRKLELANQPVQTELQQSERKLVTRFTPDQLQILERKFAISDRILKDDAVEMASSKHFGGLISSNHIQNWFMNKRQKLKSMQQRKEQGGAVSEEEETDEDEDLNPPEKSKSASDNEQCESDSKTAGQGHKSVMQNHILFLEFKKSTSLPASRLKEISKRSRLNNAQIVCWFNNMRKRLLGKTKEDLARVLKHSLSVTQIKKLSAEFSRFRYSSSTRMTHIADLLKVSKGTVQHWFTNARYYELIAGEKFKLKLEPAYNSPKKELDDVKTPSKLGLTWPQIQKLKDEFREDENLTDERAKALAIRWKVRHEKIQAWFENRKMLVSRNRENGVTDPEEDVSDEPQDQELDVEPAEAEEMQNNIRSMSVLIPKIETDVSVSRRSTKYLKLPLQQDGLFEAFKQSSEVSPTRMTELCARLDLTEKQITNWFCWMRKKLATLSGEILLASYRNRHLTAEQVEVLEAEFKQHPYLDQDNRDRLAQLLGVSRGHVKMWFANRRYYDIVTHSNNGASSLDYKASNANEDDHYEISSIEVETVSNSTDADLPFQPVITSIMSAGAENEMLSQCVDSDDIDIKREPYSDASEHEEHENPVEEPDPGVFETDQGTVDAEKRFRHVQPLTDELELTESNVNAAFWYACLDPSSERRDASSVLSEEDIAVLEAIFESNPQPSLSKMHEFARRMQVSDQTVFWWFVRKRFAVKDRSSVAEDSYSEMSETAHDDDYITSMFGPLEADEHSDPNGTEVQFVGFDDDGLDASFVHENNVERAPARMNGDVGDVIEIDSPEDDVEVQREVSLCTLEQTPHDENRASGVHAHPARDVSRKKKLVMSTHQRAILLQEFRKSPIVSPAKARMLATDLALPVKQVELWFKKKRFFSARPVGVEEDIESHEIEQMTDAQKVALKAEYDKDPRLTKVRLGQLVHCLHLRKRQIILWFKDQKRQQFPEQSNLGDPNEEEFPLLSRCDDGNEDFTDVSQLDLTSA